MLVPQVTVSTLTVAAVSIVALSTNLNRIVRKSTTGLAAFAGTDCRFRGAEYETADASRAAKVIVNICFLMDFSFSEKIINF